MTDVGRKTGRCGCPGISARNAVVFPHAVVPLGAGRASSLRLSRRRSRGADSSAPCYSATRATRAGRRGLFAVGTVVVIHKAFSRPTGLCADRPGLERFRIVEIVQESPYLRARIEHIATRDASPTVESSARPERARALPEVVSSHRRSRRARERRGCGGGGERARGPDRVVAAELPTALKQEPA